jgi:hypothetical protein
MSALRTVTAGVPAEFIFLAETQAPAPAPSPAPAPAPAPETAASDHGAGACSDPDKAALLQVRLNFPHPELLPAVQLACWSSGYG